MNPALKIIEKAASIDSPERLEYDLIGIRFHFSDKRTLWLSILQENRLPFPILTKQRKTLGCFIVENMPKYVVQCSQILACQNASKEQSTFSRAFNRHFLPSELITQLHPRQEVPSPPSAPVVHHSPGSVAPHLRMYHPPGSSSVHWA